MAPQSSFAQAPGETIGGKLLQLWHPYIGYFGLFCTNSDKLYIFFMFYLHLVYFQSFHSPRGGTGTRRWLRVSSSSLEASPRNH